MTNRLDEVISKGAGKIKSAKARSKGLLGVFNTLAQQHAEVSVLLKRARSTDEPARQQELWATIRKELLSHERAESQEVYSALKLYETARDIVERHRIESQQLEAAIERVNACDYGTHGWNSELNTLIQLVTEHVDEEEQEFFVRAQETLGEQRAKALDQPFMATKATIMGELA